MSEHLSEKRIIIGNKTLSWHSGVISDGENQSKLEPLPLAFLQYLVQNPGQVIDKEQLLLAVWQNRHVSEDAIRRVVKKIRDALGDDAKAPSFIKTIPLKGYMLIAPVSDEVLPVDKNPPTTGKFSGIWMVAVGGFLVVSVLMVGLAGYFYSSNVDVSLPVITPLTHLSGAERNGDYHPGLKTLLFSYQPSVGEPWALYQKQMATGEVRRLSGGLSGLSGMSGISGERSSITFARFSPDGRQIVYASESNLGMFSYLGDYSAQGLANITELTGPASNKRLLSWAADGQALYYKGFTAGIGIHHHSGTAIYRYDLVDQSWQQITFPYDKGTGDYYAEASPDGRYLAVLRNTADRRYSLLLLDLIEKQIKSEKSLPFFASKLLWLNNTPPRLAISSYKGDLYGFNANSDKLTRRLGSKPGLNDIFYGCGKPSSCFYMRQHQMNYADIIEISNPFSTQPLGSEQSSFAAHFESDRADFMPVYNATGDSIYFVSKGADKALLMRHRQGKLPQPLLSYDAHHVLTQLRIQPGEHFVTGKLEGRLFVFDIKLKILSFITSQSEEVAMPAWSKSGESIYFSRFEQGDYILYQYMLASGKTMMIEKGLRGRYVLPDGRVFVLDALHDLYQQNQAGERRLVVNLPLIRQNSWQIQGDYLYFSAHQHQDITLYRRHLMTGVTVQKRLFKNSWSAEFSLHPQGHKLVISVPLSDHSDLVKVQFSDEL